MFIAALTASALTAFSIYAGYSLVNYAISDAKAIKGYFDAKASENSDAE